MLAGTYSSSHSANIEESMKTKYFSKRSFKVVFMTILLLVALPVTTALAGSTGPNYPGTAATGGGNGDLWSASIGSLVAALGADGGETAQVTLASNGDSENLNMTGFGFSLPGDATITGISVEMNRYSSTSGVQDVTVRLFKAGTLVGDNKPAAGTWPIATNTVATYGGSSDLWGTTWTPAQINASNFGVTLDVTNGASARTASVDYVHITVYYKDTPTLSVTNSPVTYDGTAKSATVTGSVGGTANDIKYDGSSTAPTNAGTYAITADFTPTDTTNYNSLNDASAGNFVISKASQATLTAHVTPSTVVYGSTATLSSTGGSGTGAVTFSDGASTGCSVSGTTLSVTNASGTCSITATKAADTNYLVATSAAASVTLQKAATTTTVTGGTFNYNGAAHAATVSVTGPGGLSLSPSPSYSGSCSSAPVSVAEGTSCTASYTYAGTNNYLGSSDSQGIIINPKAASVTPAADSKTYGQTDPTLSGALSGFLAADNVTADYSRETGETVLGGPYIISAELSPAGVLSNYDITYNTADFTIDPKAASVTPAAKNKTYSEADPALTGSRSGFLAADNVTATYSREPGETVAGSPYLISAELSPAGVLSNYDITYNTADFTIDPKAASVTPDPEAKVYGAPDPALTGSLSDFLPADNVTATYSREPGETVAGGPYTISAQLSPAGVLSNYDIAYGTANFQITKKALTITGVTADDKIYDNSNVATLSGTAALVGVVTGDTVSASGTPIATFNNATVGGDKPVAVTGYTLSGADAGNYTVSQPAGLTANITPASVSATGITASNKVYDGDTTAGLDTGSAALVGAMGGDDVDLDTSAAAGAFGDKNVGTGKTVTISGLQLIGTDAANYSLTQPTATADITARDLTVTAAGVNRAYNGTTTATVTLSSDALITDTITLDYTSAAFADKNVGTNKPVAVDGISIGGVDSGNYNLLATTANTAADITAFDVTVTADAKTKFVGAPDPALTYSAAPSLFSGDAFTGALTRAAGEAVGQYAIQQGTLTAGSNYNITFVSADLSIVDTTTSILDVYIAGSLKQSHPLNPTSSTRASYAGVDAGPVQVVGMNSALFTASERVIFKFNGVATSFSELMGLPNNQVHNVYWLPWYDNKTMSTQLRLANVSATTATIRISIGGQLMPGSPFTLGAGQTVSKVFAGIDKGPVKIQSNVDILASQRVIHKANGANTSLAEMIAMPADRVNKVFWLPWYNNKTQSTQLQITNVSATAATIRVFIGGQLMAGSPFPLGAGQTVRKTFAGIDKGPVKVQSNVNILASEQVIQKVGGVPVSFTEVMGLPNSQLDTTYWMPWYTKAGPTTTQLRIANVSLSDASVHVYIGGAEVPGSPFTIPVGTSQRLTFPGIDQGPVQIVSNVKVVASAGITYKVNAAITSYAEMMALPNKLLDSIYWLPWYNNKTMNTQLRFGVP
jgi:hypothetical protein